MSPHPDADRLFERFQRTGSPQAIAAVYDKLAPELLLLAAHVGHRGIDAEDLVQTTFLAAIEHAQEWDAERPLMPWMIGILANRARSEHRARRRQPDPERLRERDSVDPADAAEEAEFLEHLQRILSGLPENYRHTMALRWIHGFAPIEIAHTLGISPETVKTRLRRGQNLLRQALPAGFASATVAGLLTPAPGLAAGRAVVLERATQVQRARAIAHAGLGLRPELLVFGTLLVVVLATVAWAVSSTSPVSNGSTHTIPSAHIATEREPPLPSGDHEMLAERRTVLPTITSDAMLVVQLRWHDGTPAQDVEVSALPLDRANPLLAERWSRSDDAGHARFDRVEPGRYTISTDRGGAVDASTDAVEQESCTLTIPRGIDLHGRVFADGAPVAGATVWLTRGDLITEGRGTVRTDAAGEFQLRSVSVDRAFCILADGFAPSPLRRAVSARDGIAIDLTKERSDATLHGRVVDESGRGVADAIVQIGSATVEPCKRAVIGELALVPPVVLRTGADGAFVRRGLPTGDIEVWARARGHGPGHSVLRRDRRSSVVEVRLTRSVVLRGRATDGAGDPIDDVRIHAIDAAPLFADDTPRWASSTCRADEDARFELSIGAVSGRAEVCASATDGRRACITLTTDRDRIWHPALARPAPFAGRVVNDRGDPLIDMEIHVSRSRRPNERFVTHTGADGRFETAFVDLDAYTLSVRDPSTLWTGARATLSAIEPSSTLEIVIAADRGATGSLSGRILDLEGNPVDASVWLSSSEPGAAYTRSHPSNGQFRFEKLPVLRTSYLVTVQSDDGTLCAFAGPFSVTANGEQRCGTIRLEPTGRLLADVIDAEHAPVELSSAAIEPARGPHRIIEAVVKDGTLQSPALPPGRYIVHLRGETFAQDPRSFTIHAGANTSLDWNVPRATVCEIEAVHEWTNSPIGIDLTWSDTEGELRCRDRFVHDPNAKLRMRQALRPGRYRILAESSAGLRADAWFEVPRRGTRIVRLEFRR